MVAFPTLAAGFFALVSFFSPSAFLAGVFCTGQGRGRNRAGAFEA